jgi:hypothetical protein
MKVKLTMARNLYTARELDLTEEELDDLTYGDSKIEKEMLNEMANMSSETETILTAYDENGNFLWNKKCISRRES